MLTDTFHRKHDYLRVSITDKCNLRCQYCMPPEGVEFLPHDQVLRNEEFIRLIGIFSGMGINKIRFTGGEPLVRKGFVDILSETRRLYPHIELAITTNGTLLGDYLDDLYRLKVKKINISLDTFSRERYEKITRRDHFDTVIANIERAIEFGFFDIKINAVLFRETLDELDDFLDYFKDKDIVLRFIERMPFSEKDLEIPFLSSDALLKELEKRGELKRDGGRDTTVSLRYNLLYGGSHTIKPVSYTHLRAHET